MTTIWIDPDELNTTSTLMVNLATQIADLAMGLAGVGGQTPDNVAAELVQAQKNLATIGEVFILGADLLAQVAAEITGDQSLASAFDSAVGPLAASALATGSAAVAEAGSSPDVVTVGGGVSPALAGLVQEPTATEVTVGGGVSPALAGLVQEPTATEVTISGTPTPAFENLGGPSTAVPVNPEANAFGINIQEQTSTAAAANTDSYMQPTGITTGVDGDNGFNFTDNFGDTNTSDSIAGHDPDSGDAVLNP
jgi:hypothetical protein